MKAGIFFICRVKPSSGECPKFCVRGLNGYPTMVG